MGQWKHKLFTRLDDADAAFVLSLGEGVLLEVSEKLRFAVRALRAYCMAGKISVRLSDVQEQLRQLWSARAPDF